MTIEVGAAARRAVRALLWLMAWLILALLAWLAFNRVRVAIVEARSPAMAAASGGQWVRAQDTDLHVVEHGDPHAPVLLLVAGTGAWAGTWRDTVPALVRAGWRVIAVDLPPFGFSQRPQGGDYSRMAQARRLLALVRDHIGVPVTLLGHSYGGGPAAEAAMREPRLIRHLVLVDAAIGLRTVASAPCEAPGPLLRLLAWEPAGTTLMAATGTQPALSAFWLRRFVARHEVVTEDRVAIYQRPLTLQGTSAAMAAWASQFVAECNDGLSHAPAGYAALGRRLTLMWGELDVITPPSQGKALHAAASGSQLRMLPGVGHIPQIEDPAGFNAQLIDLLGSLPGPPPPTSQR